MVRFPALRDRLSSYLLLVDVVVAAAVLAASVPPLVNARSCGCRPSPTWAFVLVGGQAVLLLGRRRMPFWISLAVGLATGVYGVADLPDPALPFAGLVATYSVAVYAGRRAAGVAGVCTLVGLAIGLAVDSRSTAQDWSINFLAFSTAFLLGWTVRSAGEAADALRQRADQLERTREAEARRAAVEERNRIAREMHDVVAHSLGLMIVQAEAGPVVVPRDPDRAVAAFDAISATGRSALTEMRRLLGVLRDDPSGAAPDRNPQRGMEDIPDLVRASREAGLDVHLEQALHVATSSAAVNLSAYRIVQEALTNALKHAGPAHVEVRVTDHGDALEIEVTDDGLGAATGRAADGRGLIGMRERVGLLGGELSVGPGDHSGWRVHAHLPLDAAVPR